MNETASFLTGIGVTLAVTLGVVVYLRPHLQTILVDLCGTRERANFWAAFSNVILVLAPLIGAMLHRPGSGDGVTTFFAINSQLKSALIGLVIAVAVLGLVISRFIPRGTAGPGKLPGREEAARPHSSGT